MIDPGKLRRVRTIVTHDNCPDGLASAILLHDAIPEAEVRFVQHNTAALIDLPATPNILFCDIAPPRARVAEFIAVGAIVLDHHKTQRDVVEAFGEDGVYADEAREPGVSGASLAYREVWDPIVGGQATPIERTRAMEFARLAGIRDTWQRSSPHWRDACAQAEALFFYPRERFLFEAPFGVEYVDFATMLDLGQILLERHERNVQQTLDGAYRRTSKKGTKLTIFEGLTHTSDGAEIETTADLVVGFHYAVVDTHPSVIFSTRSRGDFDCSALCRSYGGGGHTHAAGFSVRLFDMGGKVALTPAAVWAERSNPYDLVVALVDHFEVGSREAVGGRT